jgi:hypothetical protein
MKNKIEYPEWFFMWTGTSYITSICGWTKKQVVDDAVAACGESWKKIYAKGGRVIRVKMTLDTTGRAR